MKMLMYAVVLVLLCYGNSWSADSCLTIADVRSAIQLSADTQFQRVATRDATYISAVSGVVEGFHTDNLEFNMSYADVHLDIAAREICKGVESLLPVQERQSALEILARIHDLRKTYPRPSLGSRQLEERAAELDRDCLEKVAGWQQAIPVSQLSNVSLPADDDCLTVMERDTYIERTALPATSLYMESGKRAATILADLVEANHTGVMTGALEQTDRYLDEQSLVLCEWLDQDLRQHRREFLLRRLATVGKIRQSYPRLHDTSSSLTDEVSQCLNRSAELKAHSQ